MKNSEIRLKNQKEKPALRGHPWIFSGAIKDKPATLEDGDLVDVRSIQGQWIGTGHYQDSTIAVRILTRLEEPIDQSFWNKRIASSYALREGLGLRSTGQTTCFRLIHGEGDHLPGLIVDVYNKVAIVQCHSIGMYLSRSEIAKSLINHKELGLEAVFIKSEKTLPRNFAAGIKDQFEIGQATAQEVLENGYRFWVDWEQGQKTGFFIDQRVNRNLLGQYAAGKKVLNTFCYSGGFSVYALGHGAELVYSVDISEKAMEWTRQNVMLNGGENRHKEATSDVLSFLKEMNDQFDIVISDPPAFAKSMKKRHNAVQAYKRLNVDAIRRVASGGLLFTFSCSQVVDEALFYNTVVAAAIEAGRPARVIHKMTQGPDHPVNLYHPEGSYLKGLVVAID